MLRKHLGIFIFLIYIVLPIQITHAMEPNAGIVQGLWYGKEKIFANETVRMYVAIRNYTESDLTGTVEFFDGDKRIERRSVTALDGRIIESWADWTPSYGTHSLKATLSRIELSRVGSTTKEVTVTSSLAEDTIFVDYDTDSDNIGNEKDQDDDGDGISDVQEKKDGTNPLVKEIGIETPNSTSDSSRGGTDENSSANTDDTSDNTDIRSSANNRSSRGSSNSPQGLEQYLAPSPVETALGTVTNYITQTKTNLDTYRGQRAEKLTLENASSTKIEVNADGFGAITRTDEKDKNNASIEIPKIEGESFFDKLFSVIGSIATSLYTFVLATLSLILAHPIFIQLGLLLLILFGLIKLASKFGRRPSLKKAKPN